MELTHSRVTIIMIKNMHNHTLTNHRVRIAKVEVYEHERNSASYEEEYTAL